MMEHKGSNVEMTHELGGRTMLFILIVLYFFAG